MSNTNLIKKQPQIAQLELKFAGPLIKDSQVQSVNDLLSLNIRYNYQHKIVWVIEKQANYFLKNGDGSSLSHWEKHTSNLSIKKYEPNLTYFKDDTVYLGGKIYIALTDILINEIPSSNSNKWLLITGETITERFIFQNVSSFIFYTNIRNPFFNVQKGTINFDSNNNYIFEDGLIKVTDLKTIGAYIKRREDLLDNNGKAYEIFFYENNEPINLTGIINIK